MYPDRGIGSNMAKKDPFQQIMANVDWTRLVPILQPLMVFGAWLAFSKIDKRADAVSKLIAVCEPIPAIDLNVPKPVVLASCIMPWMKLWRFWMMLLNSLRM